MKSIDKQLGFSNVTGLTAKFSQENKVKSVSVPNKEKLIKIVKEAKEEVVNEEKRSPTDKPLNNEEGVSNVFYIGAGVALLVIIGAGIYFTRGK